MSMRQSPWQSPVGRFSQTRHRLALCTSTPETLNPANNLQPFRADVLCNILALYHLSASSEGGENLVASSWKVYNELAATRPDILGLLAQDDWAHDTLSQIYSLLSHGRLAHIKKLWLQTPFTLNVLFCSTTTTRRSSTTLAACLPAHQ